MFCITVFVVKIWTAGVLSAVDRLSEELPIYIEPCAVLDNIQSRLGHAEP